MNANLRPKQKKWRCLLSFAEIDAIYAKQGYQCGICGEHKPVDENHKIDHDHTTGIVRGILCNKCNMGIGLLGDTAEALRKALKYLEDNQNG